MKSRKQIKKLHKELKWCRLTLLTIAKDQQKLYWLLMQIALKKED